MLEKDLLLPGKFFEIWLLEPACGFQNQPVLHVSETLVTQYLYIGIKFIAGRITYKNHVLLGNFYFVDDYVPHFATPIISLKDHGRFNLMQLEKHTKGDQ